MSLCSITSLQLVKGASLYVSFNFGVPCSTYTDIFNFTPRLVSIPDYRRNLFFNFFSLKVPQCRSYTNNFNFIPPLMPMINSQCSKASTEQFNFSARTNYVGNRNSSALNSLVNFAETLKNKSSNEMKRLMRAKGVQFHDKLWCADSMRYVTECAISDKMASWYKNCHYQHCKPVFEAAKKNNAVVAEKKNGNIDLSNVKPGHLILFDWQKGDNSEAGKLDHIGMVKSVDYEKGIIITLEGNYSDKFTEVKRSIKDGTIQAFIDITKSA